MTIKTKLYAAITSTHKSESNVREKLSFLSRELIPYVIESNDIAAINRLINGDDKAKGLTPRNRELAVVFFKEFTPWVAEHAEGEKKTAKNFVRFGKRMNAKAADKRISKLQAFLRNDSADIWSWASMNVATTERRKPEALAKIATYAKKAVAEGKDADQILQALVAGGVDVLSLKAAVGTLSTSESAKDAALEMVAKANASDDTPVETKQAANA